MQGGHVAASDERLPPVEVAAVRLARHAAAEPLEVALDDGAPLLQGGRGEADGESAVEPPGSPLGAGELRDHGPPGHFEAVAHAGQQPVELVIAQLDLAGQELADAGLANAAKARQRGLGGARFAHHLAEQVTTSRHITGIASDAIRLVAAPRLQQITGLSSVRLGRRLSEHRIRSASPRSRRAARSAPLLARRLRGA